MEQVKERKSPAAPSTNPGQSKIIHNSHDNKTGTESNEECFRAEEGENPTTLLPEVNTKQMASGNSKNVQRGLSKHSSDSDPVCDTKSELSEDLREIIRRNLTRLEFEIIMGQSFEELFKELFPDFFNSHDLSICPWCEEDDPPTFYIENGRGHCEPSDDSDYDCGERADVIDLFAHAKGLDHFGVIHALSTKLGIPLDLEHNEDGYPLPYREISGRKEDNELIGLNDLLRRWSCSFRAIAFLWRHGILRIPESAIPFPEKIFPLSMVVRLEQSYLFWAWLRDSFETPFRDLVRYQISKRGDLAIFRMILDEVCGPAKVSDGTASLGGD